MHYKSHYKEARDRAWEYLIRHRARSLPIDVLAFCKKDGITVLPYSAREARQLAAILRAEDLMRRTDGFAVSVGKETVIFYDDACTPQRQRFTIAHEIGHIMLGDVGPVPTQRNAEPSAKDDPKEQAANVFASRILAPACVLWALKVQDAEQLAELCDISITAARYRCARMSLLYEREKDFMARYGKSCFLMSSLERKVYKRFRRYIKSVRL